jgi:CspA family cold shock protein
MSEGKVKWFNTRKGYGFISTTDGADIFVHYSNISGDGYKTLVEGDPVTFDTVEGEKGLRAENVVQQTATASKPATATKSATASKPATEDGSIPESKPATEEESTPESKSATEGE